MLVMLEAAQEVESSLADSAAASQAAANAPVETSVTATTVAGKTNDDDTDLRMDLTDFSDQELVQLAKALQEELDSYSDQQVPIAREEQVPLMLLPAEFISSSRNVVRFPRDRRAVGRLVHGDDGAEEEIVLEPLGALQLGNVEDSDPIIVVPDEPAPEREQYVIIEENPPSAFASVPEDSPKAVLLSEAELDDLELRSRIAELSDLLRERALRDI
ncbi:hypothetical protein AAVH_04070 [Aphelenchoides avenae]|nr:hypothetical protein AAVH_04070 [Aphelenchus avenae]